MTTRSDLKATLGAGWNRYDGEHFGKVIWEMNTPYYIYKDADGNKLKDANGTVTKPYTPTTTVYPDFEYYRNEAWKSDFNVYAKVSSTFLTGLNAYVDLQYRHVGFRLQDPATGMVPTPTTSSGHTTTSTSSTRKPDSTIS